MKKTILTVAVFLMGISLVNAALINSYDFKGGDTAEQLSDKTGSKDLDNHYDGGVTANDLNASSGIVLTDTGGHSGYASFFPGFTKESGVTDFIGCDADNPDSYAVSFWTRFADNAQAEYQSLFASNDGSGTWNWQVDFNGSGNIRLNSGNLADQNIVSDPTENIWHHLVVIKAAGWSNGTQVYYDNERVVLEANIPGGINNYWFGTSRDQRFGFAGDIANVKIYDEPLNGGAVDTLYSEGAIPEPMSAALFGFIGLLALLRKRIIG